MNSTHSLLMGGSESGMLPDSLSFSMGGAMDVWNQDPRAIWSSFAMIVVSEIGDKTFLIAAILAMRQSKAIIFAGAFSSLAVMSVLSALLGVVLPSVLPKWVTTFFAALLFFGFGTKMLRDGLKMTGDEIEEEWQEAEREIAQQDGDHQEDHELNVLEQGTPQHQSQQPTLSTSTSEMRKQKQGGGGVVVVKESTTGSVGFKEGAKNLCGLCCSPIFAQAFVLTFLGEWGDRSQIATIALAAAHNVILVCIGTIAGHALCTSTAVICGSWLANKISVRQVTLCGAFLFLLFGVIYLYESLFHQSSDPSPPSIPIPIPIPSPSLFST